MQKGVAFFILLLISSFVFSSNEQYLFRRISIAEGLSNSWVRSCYQDRFGYLWFGTDDGLNRFDGRNIRSYRPVNDNQMPMGNVAINAISEADSQSFWLCTDLGLFRFFIESETIVRDTLISYSPVLSVVKDWENNSWFGTSDGLYKISSDQKTKKNYRSDLSNVSSISDNYVNTLFVDSRGEIWIGTKHGLNRYDKESDSFHKYLHNQQEGSLSGNDITSIFEDNRNRIWVGTSLDGLNVFTYQPETLYFSKVFPGSITTLLQDKNNRLWVGMASGGGISIIDLKDYDKGKLSIEKLKNNPLDKNSLGDNSVFKIFQDNNSDLWIATFGGGVNFYSNRAKQFKVVNEKYDAGRSISNNLVNTFFEEDNYFWIGTEGGLDRLDKKTGIFKHYQYNPDNPRMCLPGYC